MNMLTDSPGHVTGGVDTHADIHVAAVMCSQSHQLLATATFPTSPAGYVKLLDWLGSFGCVDQVGIEGTGTYGAGLARYLTAMDVSLVEVDRPDRVARRLHGKSDTVDAEAAARAVLSGRANGTPKTRDGIIEAIRVLQVVYRSAVKDRTAAINQFHAIVVSAPAQIREMMQQMPLKQRLQRARRWRDRNDDDIATRGTRQALRELALRIELLIEQADRTQTELDVLTDIAAPALRDLVGVGVHAAARLLITVGDNPERIHSEAAFAHLCGVAPIQASSGKTNRHRLNRGGDRSANHALWTIAMSRRTCDDRTRAYLARRTTEGLSDREIMRCLKRYIAREVHRAITRPLPLAPRGAELRRLRTEAGLPLRTIAEKFDITTQRLSRIERGLTRDPDMHTRIHAWLTEPDIAQIAA